MWIAQGHASKWSGVPYTEFYKALTKPWLGGGQDIAILPALLCVGVKRSKGEDEGVISVVEEG